MKFSPKFFISVFFLLCHSLFFADESDYISKQHKQNQEISEAKTTTPRFQPGLTDTDSTNFFQEQETDSPVTYKGTFTKMILSLLSFILLIVFSVWILRKISRGRVKQMNYGREIKILERRPLSAKSVLYLIEVSGKRIVVSESQLEVRTITTADHLTEETV